MPSRRQDKNTPSFTFTATTPRSSHSIYFPVGLPDDELEEDELLDEELLDELLDDEDEEELLEDDEEELLDEELLDEELLDEEPDELDPPQPTKNAAINARGINFVVMLGHQINE
ncbi:MAG: hypothetical protein NVV73_02875 [Cellvibrionaceae bacterium]|nr:hypothetical protein [Cellvibrionaceae bacterium]